MNFSFLNLYEVMEWWNSGVTNGKRFGIYLYKIYMEKERKLNEINLDEDKQN